MKMKIYIGIMMLLFSFVIRGQENSVKLLTQSTDNSVLLRWAPSNKITSDWIVKYGVNIERTRLKVNGELDPAPQKEILNSSPIIPLSSTSKKWDENENDKYVLIVWQFLYGEFPNEELKGSSASLLLNEKQNREMMFGFFLLSTDFSQKAAEFGGLFYEDKTAKVGDEYVYSIVPAKQNKQLNNEEGVSVNGINNTIDFPNIRKPSYTRKNKTVEITWDIAYLNYTGYVVERSINNKDFTPLNEDPIVSISEIEQNIVSFRDKAVDYGETYYYRIKGINSFATKSPASEEIKVEVYEQLTVAPKITEAIPMNEKVELTWEWNETEKQKANQLYIARSGKLGGVYKTISGNLFNKETLFSDSKPLPGNYYQFIAKNKQGDSVVSSPIFVQLKDDTPPVKPTGLNGTIDTNGIVTLNWTKNKEQDIYGYRVFRVNFKNHEFFQVTTGAWKDSVYIDTIPLDNLTSSIFYKLVAIDYHFNPSEFSEPVEIMKPDTIAPISPLFTSYQTNEYGVELNWFNSASKDVVTHILYRKVTESNEWKELKIFNNNETTYFDSVEIDEYVVYKIIAKDRAGLVSQNAKLLEAKKLNTGYDNTIPLFELTKNTEDKTIILRWDVTRDDVEQVVIYKSKDDAKLRLVNTVNYDELELLEKDIKVGASYNYSIKFLLKNGKESKYSELKSVQW